MTTKSEIDTAEKELLAAEQAYEEKRELLISAQDGFAFALANYKLKLSILNAAARAALAASFADAGVPPHDPGHG